MSVLSVFFLQVSMVRCALENTGFSQLPQPDLNLDVFCARGASCSAGLSHLDCFEGPVLVDLRILCICPPLSPEGLVIALYECEEIGYCRLLHSYSSDIETSPLDLASKAQLVVLP